jgi:ribosomal protein L11 methyltransferase
MYMQFIEVKISAAPDISEILLAELIAVGYDSFQETDEGLDAYVEEALFSEAQLREILAKYAVLGDLPYSFSKLEQKNWNEEWEKNFQPVTIGNTCIVRASFHQPDKEYQYDIVINPKMSFGTGHHETTSMMLAHQLEIDHHDKSVMDAGSGTGILAIMASKLQARLVDAFDIEDWAFDNLKENIILNNCLNVEAEKGTVTSVGLRQQEYDIILANINRNVLLDEIPEYHHRLKAGGTLVLSGFYMEDIPLIEERAAEFGLKKTSVKEKNNWASLVFIK